MHQCKADCPLYQGERHNSLGIWLVDCKNDSLHRVCSECVGKISNPYIYIRELERHPGDDQYLFKGVLWDLNNLGEISPITTYAEGDIFNFSWNAGDPESEFVDMIDILYFIVRAFSALKERSVLGVVSDAAWWKR